MVIDWTLIVRWLVEVVVASGVLIWLARRCGPRELLLLTIGSFALRLALGEGLYFVSLFHLPILASEQMPDGFWLLAPDAASYNILGELGRQSLAKGFVPFLLESYQYLFRPTFVLNQDPFSWSLSVIYEVFGSSPAQGLVFNAAVAAGCAPLAWLIAKSCRMSQAAAAASAALVAFWPSSLLWSGQLLKDPLSWLAIFAVAAGAAYLLDVAQEPPTGHGRVRWVPAGLLILTGSLIQAGIRGRYLAPVWLVAVCSAVVIVCLAGARSARRGRLQPGASAALKPIVVVLLALVLGSAAAYGPVATTVVPLATAPTGTAPTATAPTATARTKGDIACHLAAPFISARQGFIRTGGDSLSDTYVPPSCEAVLLEAPLSLGATFLGIDPRILDGPSALIDISAVDTVLIWVLMPGLLIGALMSLRKRHAGLSMLLVFVIVLGLFLGFVVVNFGTLFRLRLEVWLPATILAVDGWYALLAVTRRWGHNQAAPYFAAGD